MGSLNPRRKGLTSVICIISPIVMFSPSISPKDLKRGFPVSLRIRYARRYRSLEYKRIVSSSTRKTEQCYTHDCELVSGKKRARNTQDAPESQHKIQIAHVHPSACTAKPPMTGPSTGPQTAASPQRPMTTALHSSVHISTRLAPPVASAGLPTKPARNLKGRRAPRFFESAVGICSRTKMRRETMYTDVRPN